MPITLEDIQRAKQVLAQAEAAHGVAQPKAKVIRAPTHPRHLEDPAFGDKTPAVVEWYRDNDPEEYKRRYAGRKTHLEDRRKERPRLVVPERGQSANDKVRNSQERENASRRSLFGLEEIHQDAISNADVLGPKLLGNLGVSERIAQLKERSERNAEITRAEIIKILGNR